MPQELDPQVGASDCGATTLPANPTSGLTQWSTSRCAEAVAGTSFPHSPVRPPISGSLGERS